jgi:hypothetical protein
LAASTATAFGSDGANSRHLLIADMGHFLLLRQAKRFTVGAKNAAIAWRRPNPHVAVGAAMKNEAVVVWNFQLFPKAAEGAGEIGLAAELVCHNRCL